jgi:two-component system phosphate regulon sensor histidine kinase PhoR
LIKVRPILFIGYRATRYNLSMGLRFRLRFRVWMPLLAVLLVLLAIATLLLYVLPTAKSRLSGYAKDRAVAQADAAANAAADSEGRPLRRELRLATDSEGGEVLVVDDEGQVIERIGERLLHPTPEDLLQQAAAGERVNEMIGGRRVAVVPLVRKGDLAGGIVFVAGDSEDILYRLFMRSGIEAAVVASLLGGGLALLLAILLGRRVGRITLGAREMAKGDLSSRIKPGFDDELGELAKTFNSMAERLESSFLQLEEKGATLGAILNNLAEGVLVTDLSGNVTFINPSARAMLGLVGEERSGVLPSPWKDFDLPGAVSRCAKERECGEARVRDGESFLEVRLEHMPAYDEHKGGVLVVIRDLSEGRRLEANQQRFLANAAHELKTPITTILGASELLLTESEDDPEVRHRFLNHILSEARRMQRLSDTLLRLARTGVDLRDPEILVVDLDGATREAVERMEPLAESAGLVLRVEGQGGRVRADHEWLEQALLVVLGNAVRHSERGSEVRVRVESGAVTVEDEGTGISEADLPYVFERFYQGKRSSGGFGLGLAICKDLVERMGGSISLYSEEGVGTRVEMELPEV